MQKTILHFPNIQLQERDGHKLRGYFAGLFGGESDLFHNHTNDGRFRYRYPRIQYKVVNGQPMLLGIAEGASLLSERFLRIKTLQIDDQHYTLEEKNLDSSAFETGVRSEWFYYQFISPWLGLNQQNYRRFKKLDQAAAQQDLESRILPGQILRFFTGVGHFEPERVKTNILAIHTVTVQLKNQPMLGFRGRFRSNALLPDYIGLGKSVSRGFGTIVRLNPPI